MPRKERIQEVGYYHIVNRGVERRDIFLEPEDYDYFLEMLLKIKKDCDITMHAFCLMTNHYHLLLETKQKNLSKAIQSLNVMYAKYFNKKYTRVGHLWQGRYKSYSLYDDAHFWIVAKYIERNPIKAKMVHEIDSYRYQSYFQRKHQHEHFALLQNSMIFDMTLDEYSSYIDSDLQTDAIDIVYDSPKVIIKDKKIILLKKRLHTFFQEDKDINKNENIKKAYEYGYTKSEIAKYLNLAVSSVVYIVSDSK